MYLITALGEKLERGEALDLDIFDLVGSGVHLGDHDVLVVFIFFRQLVPDWSQLLAVATPWSI